MSEDELKQANRWATRIRSFAKYKKFTDEQVLQKMDEAIEYWLIDGQSWKDISRHIRVYHAFKETVDE